MLVFILATISFLPLTIGNEATRQNGSFILLIYSIIGFFIFYKPKQIAYLVTPISLVFFYTSISLMVGAWAFENGYVIVANNYRDYKNFQQMDKVLCLILLCLTTFAAVELANQKNYQSIIAYAPIKSNKLYIVGALPLLLFFFIPLNLDEFGGQGDLAIMPKTIVALVVIVLSQNLNLPFNRWLIYVSLIFIFSIFSIQDKRESIFLIFPIVYLEIIRKKRILTWRLGLIITLIIAFLTILILAMSVARGYGEIAGIEDLFEALPTISSYFQSDDFLTGFFANIEVSYFFFHAVNSVDFVLGHPEVVALGSTIIKPLFLFFPRSVFPWKPDSIIEKYTTSYDADLRSLGGSWPISVFSEFIWNFHLFGIIFTFIFAKILVWYQIQILKSCNENNFHLIVFLMFVYINIVVLSRGSGFDQFFLFLVSGGFCSYSCRFINILISKTGSEKIKSVIT